MCHAEQRKGVTIKMNIVICVKEVRAELVFSSVKQKYVINPFDYYAIEQAKMLGQSSDRDLEITALIMGVIDQRIVTELNALGCKRIIYLSDTSFAGADTLATSYVLAKALSEKIDYDYIFCGDHTIDGETGQVGISLAERLHIRYVGNVESVKIVESQLTCELIEDGWKSLYQLEGKAVITFRNCTIRETKLTLMQIKRAKSVPYEVWGSNEIGADLNRCGVRGSRTKVVATRPLTDFKQGSKITKYLEGDVLDNSLKILSMAGGIHG